MSGSQSLLTRDDTLFGVCAGLGEDLGFNPLYLRILFAVSLLWNPAAAVGLYAGLGAVVALSRWLAPAPKAAEAVPPVSAGAPAEAEPLERLAA